MSMVRAFRAAPVLGSLVAIGWLTGPPAWATPAAAPATSPCSQHIGHTIKIRTASYEVFESKPLGQGGNGYVCKAVRTDGGGGGGGGGGGRLVALKWAVDRGLGWPMVLLTVAKERDRLRLLHLNSATPKTRVIGLDEPANTPIETQPIALTFIEGVDLNQLVRGAL